MIYRLEFTVKAGETYAYLPPSVKQRVKEGFRFLGQNPLGGEPLRNELAGRWKFRVGRFRIIYRMEVSRRVVLIIAVGPRQDIYGHVADILKAEEQVREGEAVYWVKIKRRRRLGQPTVID